MKLLSIGQLPPCHHLLLQHVLLMKQVIKYIHNHLGDVTVGRGRPLIQSAIKSFNKQELISAGQVKMNVGQEEMVHKKMLF